MGHHKTEVIKKLTIRDNPGKNQEKTTTIGANLSLSGNATIAATGAGVSGSSSTLDGAINSNNSIKIAAKSSTSNLKKQNKATIDAANAAGIIVMQQMPGDAAGWRAFGYETTIEIVSDTKEAGQPTNGSVTQGDHLGDADVHWDQADNVDNSRVLVSKGVVSDRSSYIDVTNHDDSTSKSSMTVTLPADYLNVPLNFIVIPSNSLGDGLESVPFGGGRRIQ